MENGRSKFRIVVMLCMTCDAAGRLLYLSGIRKCKIVRRSNQQQRKLLKDFLIIEHGLHEQPFLIVALELLDIFVEDVCFYLNNIFISKKYQLCLTGYDV